MRKCATLTTALLCGVVLAGCASTADKQRQWRLFAVEKCEPVRGSGTPAFDRCVEETMSQCEAGNAVCK